jgi:hypothetical protein
MKLRVVTDNTVQPYENVDTNGSWFQTHARACGEEYKTTATTYLRRSGAQLDDISRVDIFPVDGAIITTNGTRIVWMANGCFDEGRHAGLRRTSTVEKLLGRAYALHAIGAPPMLLVTSHLPNPGSQSAHLLGRASEALNGWLVDVIATTGDLAGYQRLTHIINNNLTPSLGAPWRYDTKPAALDLFCFTPTEEAF